MAPSSSSRLLPNAAQWWRGFMFVLIATLALSLQNVLARIAQSPKALPILGGLFQLGGYVEPDANKLKVSLFVLLLRVTFVVPLLWLLLPVIKRDAWTEAKTIVTGNDRPFQIRILAAGLLLFFSQTGIYLAIANVGPATAITLFFIYPTITTLLAWRLFSDRPSWQQWVAIGLIYTGCAWLAFSAPHASFKADSVGIAEAMFAGVVFAMEGIIAQSCFNKVNPATFTGLIFSVEWLALVLVAIVSGTLAVNPGLVLMGALLSLATLSGYLFNNFGIQSIGAASVAIIGSSGNAVTAVLAGLILGDILNARQWIAILLVSGGVVLMNWAKTTKYKLAVEPASVQDKEET